MRVNWLAHLRLAPEEPLLRLGNLCGDFVRGVDLATLHPRLRQGVLQHRAIDRFVDAHPVVRASRARLEAPFTRFAGVLVDVFYDHFLACDWARLGSGGTLADYADAVHRDLERYASLLPDRLARAVPPMRTQHWFERYAEPDGIADILARMATRLGRETVLGRGHEQLRAHRDALGADFAVLWPELLAAAAGIHRAPVV